MKRFKNLLCLIIIVIPMFCFGQNKSSANNYTDQKSTTDAIEFSLERTSSQLDAKQEKRKFTHYQLYINGECKTLDAEGNEDYIVSWIGGREILRNFWKGYKFIGYPEDNVKILRRSHSDLIVDGSVGGFSPCTSFILEKGKTIYQIECQ
jgi:hypothetical protein